jgi:Flp pilus assembly protein TadD
MYRHLLSILALVSLICVNIWSCQSWFNSGKQYASLQPETAYVGMAKCQSCHAEIFDDYIQTGMGRSLYLPKASDTIEDFSPQSSVYDPMANLNYQAQWREGKLSILEYRLNGQDTIHQLRENVDYIIGSGNQTRSYLFTKNGYLYEAPITWYVAKRKWDLSPGYEGGKNSRFSRAIGLECLFCHNALIQPTPHTVNHYPHQLPLGIDCERCHGPGSEHVRKMEADDIVDIEREIDYSIVNPAKLGLEAQFDVCQQCHLQGTNVGHAIGHFRPGARLHDYFQVFLDKERQPKAAIGQHMNADQAAFGIASQAERLQQSKCFLQSNRQLTCNNCHNPHKSVHRTNPAHFVQQCQKCHQQKPCTAPMATRKIESDNCVKCHMPKGGTSDIPHVSFTDHYIRIIQTEQPKTPNEQKPDGTAIGEIAKPATIPAQRAFIELLCATSPKSTPDQLGRAYLRYYEQVSAQSAYLDSTLKYLADTSAYPLAKALYYLQKYTEAAQFAQQASAKQPNDPWVNFLVAEIKEAKGDYVTAYQDFLSIYNAHPYLTEAANRGVNALLNAKAGKPDALIEAEKVLQRALKQKPFDCGLLTNMGFVCMNSQRYVAAKGFLKKALEYDPDYALALENMAYVLTLTRDHIDATKYLNRLEQSAQHKGRAERLRANLQQLKARVANNP